MFAGERLVWAGGGAQVRYRLPWAALQWHRPEQQQKSIELRLSASEFLDRVAALIPPPRKHRHRYFGVVAPNSPWRALVAANAGRKLGAGSKAPRPKKVRTDFGATRAGHPARYSWAQLLARIYEVFPLKCSGCGGRIRLVGFITEPAKVRQILEHVGEPTSAPAIAPARTPPLEMEFAQRLAAPESVFEAITELEFDQTANLRAEAGHDRLLHNAGVDAEPILELDFDQPLVRRVVWCAKSVLQAVCILPCCAYQISANTEQKRLLTRRLWLVGVSTKKYLNRVGSGRIVSRWIGA